MSTDEQKKAVAEAALKKILPDLDEKTILGIGTGSTANHFIDLLADYKTFFDAAVASSDASAERLRSHGITVTDLNSAGTLPWYIDGADAFNPALHLVKGGGGALTREKVVAAASRRFLCIVDESKQVDVLGDFPLAVEVIPMARSYVGREIVKLGGDPVYREGFTTDNGNIILDVHNLRSLSPVELEVSLNNIAGVVCNGLFAQRPADLVLMATAMGVKEIRAKT